MKTKLLIFFALVIFFVPRLWRLGSLPQSLNRDEAALAYNAILLKDTSKDEWGRRWPLALESFGDFKLIGYPAVLAVLFRLVPANDFWARFPAAVAGLSLPFLAFWFARLLKMKKIWAVVFAFSIATAPVFFFFSRMAFEAVLALSLFIAAVCFWLEYLQKYKFKHALFALLLFVLAGLTYNTPLLLWLIYLPMLPFLATKQHKKSAFIFSLLSLIFIAGLFFSLWSLIGQKSGITIFSDETTWMEFVTYRSQFSGLLIPILGNRYLFWLLQMLKRLLATFSWHFLVAVGGTHPWHALPGWAHIFAHEYLLGVFGVVLVVKEAIYQHKKQAIILLLLLIGSILPAIVTVDAPHATRSLLFFFLFLWFAVYALAKLASYLYLRKQIIVLYLVISLSFYAAYTNDYFHTPLGFEPGLSEIITSKIMPNDKVAVVDGGGYQYIVFSWYAKISPVKYFSTVARQLPDDIGLRYGERVGQFHFIAAAKDASPQENIILSWTGTKWEITGR